MKKIGRRQSGRPADIFLIALCLASFLCLSRLTTGNGALTRFCTKTLEEKQTNVNILTTISAGASFAVSLLPGDTGTAVSEKLMDLTGYLVLISAAIYVGKWLVAVAGTLAFRFVIPIGCVAVLILSHIGSGYVKARVIIGKIMALSVILFAVVPLTVTLSESIDAVSDHSIQSRIESLQEDSDEAIEESQSASEDDSVLDKISSFAKRAAGGISALFNKFKVLLQNMLDMIAAMIVTSCLIPIIVLAVLIWVVNMIFGTALKMPDPKKVTRKVSAGMQNMKQEQQEKNATDVAVEDEAAEK